MVSPYLQLMDFVQQSNVIDTTYSANDSTMLVVLQVLVYPLPLISLCPLRHLAKL